MILRMSKENAITPGHRDVPKKLALLLVLPLVIVLALVSDIIGISLTAD